MIGGEGAIVKVYQSYVMFYDSDSRSGLPVKEKRYIMTKMCTSSALFVDYESWIGLQIKQQTRPIIVMVCHSYLFIVLVGG